MSKVFNAGKTKRGLLVEWHVSRAMGGGVRIDARTNGRLRRHSAAATAAPEPDPATTTTTNNDITSAINNSTRHQYNHSSINYDCTYNYNYTYTTNTTAPASQTQPTFRTAVPIRGHTTRNSTGSSLKRDCSSKKGLMQAKNSGLPHLWKRSSCTATT